MQLNPNAFVFWSFLFCVGYLIGGITSAIGGLTIGLGLSLFVCIASNLIKTK